MQARRGKVDPHKHRCDRHQGPADVVYECSFHFRELYAYWKGLWQARTGKRLTNRRKKRMLEREEEQTDLRGLSEVVYYMDLCSACWDESSAPWREGFPEQFYHQRLCNYPGGAFVEGAVLADKFVPAEAKRGAPGPSGAP